MSQLKMVTNDEFFDRTNRFYCEFIVELDFYIDNNLVGYEYHNEIIQSINDDKVKFVQENRPNYNEIFKTFGCTFDENDEKFLSNLDGLFFDRVITAMVATIFPNLDVYCVDFEKRLL